MERNEEKDKSSWLEFEPLLGAVLRYNVLPNEQRDTRQKLGVHLKSI